MGLLRRKIQVKPNQRGYLYRNNQFERELDPGIYHFFDPLRRLDVFSLPLTKRMITVTNQEVLTRDNIAFRFSYFIIYTIADGRLFLQSFDLSGNLFSILVEAEGFIHNFSQLGIKNKIASLNSDELEEKREELSDLKDDAFVTELAAFGIEIQQVVLRDLTFPRPIQNLFAKQLEAKIRAQSDLENARTTVATARALKNASKLMEGDDSILFLQFLETISKISDKGKHTFMIGDFPQVRGSKAGTSVDAEEG